MDAERDAALQKVLDDFEAMQRKAAAWDAWRAMVARCGAFSTWEGAPINLVLDALEGKSS